MPPNDLFTDFGVNFFANLGGALFGVLLAFLIERALARHENKRLYGRVLRGCRFELGYLRTSVQNDRDRLRAGSAIPEMLSAGLPATRAALVNPLVHEYPYGQRVVTVLYTVSEYTKRIEKGLADWEALRPKLAKSDTAANERLRETLVDSMTRLGRMIGLALDTLDGEIRRFGTVARPDPADQAMAQSIHKILKEPIEEPQKAAQ